MPLALATVDARFPNGRFQSFQLIGVDDATLFGLPPLQDGVSPTVLRTPDAGTVELLSREGEKTTLKFVATKTSGQGSLSPTTIGGPVGRGPSVDFGQIVGA